MVLVQFQHIILTLGTIFSKIYDDLDDFLQFYAHMNLISIDETDLNFEGKGGLPCKFLRPDWSFSLKNIQKGKIWPKATSEICPMF